MPSNTEPFNAQNIGIQSWLRPALTPVCMNCDFERFRSDLEKMDGDLRASAVESLAVELALEALGPGASERQKRKRLEFAPIALRMELLRHLLGLPSFRSFSKFLAGSDLLADFCGVRTIFGIRWTSKSTLERASKLWSPGQLERLNALLCEVAANDDLKDDVQLPRAIDASVCLLDSTCLEANIHFPVDWVFLSDVGKTLLKAVTLIRQRGLKHRMPSSPKELARQMNRLCIEMTHTRGRVDGKKRRKGTLRSMKKLLKSIGKHAEVHRELLVLRREETDLSPAEAAQICERIDKMLTQLPDVIKQAHERIIGGRQVKSREKILSVHQGDLHVIVRGKANKKVEFGNAMLLCESPDGFILDYKLYQDTPPSDAAMLSQSLEKQQSYDIDVKIEALVGDRGFATKATANKLKCADIENHTCPRIPDELGRRMKDPTFASWQRRRGSTEARIAILKNNGSRVCRAKGFDHRSMAIGWGVLAHNLWWIARIVRENRDAEPAAA